jgi:hypothetical protein
MFEKYFLDYKTNIFDELSRSIEYEDITKGRKGAILVDCKNDLIPLVRTTTNYKKPTQRFLRIHYDIIEQIKNITNNNELDFNNAMIEIYDSKYCTMGFHSDQATDLAKDSYICIFSCYDNPNTNDVRKLKVKEKNNENTSNISMDHNSIVVFPLTINCKYLHKIVLEQVTSNERWLGITFRLSNTFIQFINEIPYFYPTDRILRLANKNEKDNFYKYRSLENKNILYTYPVIDYTISASDIMPIN